MTTIPKSPHGSGASHRTTSLQDMTTSSDDETPVEIVSILENDDCLCFARQETRLHPGNVQFQRLVDEYANRNSVENVQETAQQVILEFQSRHGRFVEKLPSGALAALLPNTRRLLEYVLNALQQASPRNNKRRSTRAKMPTKRLVDERFDKPTTRRRRAITSIHDDDDDSRDDSSFPLNQAHKVPEDNDDEYRNDQDENSNLIHVLKDADVISTKGGGHILPHAGNVRFVHMSAAYGKRYHKARSEQGRFAVVQDFIQEFQQQGHFVKQLGNGMYQKLPHGSVVQKVTRALKRAKASARNKGTDTTDSSQHMPKRTRRKRTTSTVGNDKVEIVPTSQNARESTTRFGRKRRCVSRFQDEQEVAPVARPRLVKTTAEIMVGPTPVKRTSLSSVQDMPPKTVANKRRTLPPNRVSPDTVPTMTPSSVHQPLVWSSSRGIPIVPKTLTTPEMPLVLGANGTPHGLGLLAQRFTKWVMATKNFDHIDLDVAVKALKIPKRRIYDVINILEGAGVLQRKEEPKNVFSWVAPLVDNTRELQQALEQQDEQLDKWTEMLTTNRQQDSNSMEECSTSIAGSQLAPLVGLETTLLAVHVPRRSFLRTIHTMPFDSHVGPVAFKITEKNDGEPNHLLPKACLLQHGETQLRPVAVKTALSPSKAALCQSPAIECHDPNLFGTLIQVLPKPPPKASLSYKQDVSPGFQPIQVSDEDARDASPFQALWREEDEDERRQSPFEALLKASEAVCD